MNGAADQGCAWPASPIASAGKSPQSARSGLPQGLNRCRQHPAAKSGIVAVSLIDISIFRNEADALEDAPSCMMMQAKPAAASGS